MLEPAFLGGFKASTGLIEVETHLLLSLNFPFALAFNGGNGGGGRRRFGSSPVFALLLLFLPFTSYRWVNPTGKEC